MSEEKYHIPDPEELVVCPYDESHMIRQKRMVYHLMKCRMNHPGNDFGTCPFNARHEIPKPELRYHIANCPDRCRIENDLNYAQQNGQDTQSLRGCTDVPSYNTVPLAPPSEDWDSVMYSHNETVDNYHHGVVLFNAESMEAGDRYTHMPQIYKQGIAELQQRKLKQYYLGSSRKNAASMPVVSSDHQTVPAISAKHNPIYAMSMAGAGRGRLTQKSPQPAPMNAAVQAKGPTTQREILAAMGRGRGQVKDPQETEPRTDL